MCHCVTGWSKTPQWTGRPSEAFLLSTSPADPTWSLILDSKAADTAVGGKTHASLFTACPYLRQRQKRNTLSCWFKIAQNPDISQNIQHKKSEVLFLLKSQIKHSQEYLLSVKINFFQELRLALQIWMQTFIFKTVYMYIFYIFVSLLFLQDLIISSTPAKSGVEEIFQVILNDVHSEFWGVCHCNWRAICVRWILLFCAWCTMVFLKKTHLQSKHCSPETMSYLLYRI